MSTDRPMFHGDETTGWRFAMDHVRAALETDTTKGNQ